MRIIKHGNQYELGEITCKKCGCVFAYNGEDIRTESYTDYSSYDHDEYNTDIVYCPECHHPNDISR